MPSQTIHLIYKTQLSITTLQHTDQTPLQTSETFILHLQYSKRLKIELLNILNIFHYD